MSRLRCSAQRLKDKSASFHRLLLLFLAISLIAFLPACEKENNHPVATHDYDFNWAYYIGSADQEYMQPLPPFTVGENGEIWTCGYLTSGSFNDPVMAHYTDQGWLSYIFASQAYNSYAYDIKVQPGNNDVWAAIKVEVAFGGEGIYRFNPGLSVPRFTVVQSLPDPGMLAFFDQTHGVMITRHVDQAASALWLFDGQNWTSHPFQFGEIHGDVIDVSTYGEDYLTYAITDDNYLIRWRNQFFDFEEFSHQLYSVVLTGIDEAWLCADDGLYHKTADGSWTRESTYPGDKAFSVSFAGGKMWITGEKDGTKKVWKLANGIYSEESSEGTGNGRLIMVPQQTVAPYHGYLLEDLRLLKREWEVQ
jgi:hypothetical protein